MLFYFKMFCAFNNGPSKVEDIEGGKFELFGGNITGEFTELVTIIYFIIFIFIIIHHFFLIFKLLLI